MAKKAAAKPADEPRIRRWLFKSEPDAFSWEMLKERGARGEPWDGVRNYQARNNMRAMQVGDLGFFYHSNVGKEIVGVVEVIAPAHLDPKDSTGQWECVDVRAVTAMPRPVTLVEAKTHPELAGMALVTSTRLSVQPVTDEEWDFVCRLGGLDPKKIKASRAKAKTA